MVDVANVLIYSVCQSDRWVIVTNCYFGPGSKYYDE